jgi:hypothetical protein
MHFPPFGSHYQSWVCSLEQRGPPEVDVTGTSGLPTAKTRSTVCEVKRDSAASKPDSSKRNEARVSVDWKPRRIGHLACLEILPISAASAPILLTASSASHFRPSPSIWQPINSRGEAQQLRRDPVGFKKHKIFNNRRHACRPRRLHCSVLVPVRSLNCNLLNLEDDLHTLRKRSALEGNLAY